MPTRIKAKKNIDGMLRINGYYIVPCNKCNNCRLRRVNDWVTRLQAEDRHYNGGLFLTLTYNAEKVPITPKGYMSVSKRDIQLFMKRLRKTCDKKVKYYCAAEYGSQTMRPHYHLIIFGVPRETIDKAWGNGDIHVGNVTSDSIAYSLKYITKESQIPKHVNDDRQKEFSLMSKNLGMSYLTPQMKKWHIENLASYVVKEGGYTQSLPRYYRDKIFSEQQKLLIREKQNASHLAVHEYEVKQAGSIQEYYRLKGELARQETKKLKLKHLNDNGKI